MKSIDFRIFRTNWIPDFLPIGSLWLETSATALCGPYVKSIYHSVVQPKNISKGFGGDRGRIHWIGLWGQGSEHKRQAVVTIYEAMVGSVPNGGQTARKKNMLNQNIGEMFRLKLTKIEWR